MRNVLFNCLGQLPKAFPRKRRTQWVWLAQAGHDGDGRGDVGIELSVHQELSAANDEPSAPWATKNVSSDGNAQA